MLWRKLHKCCDERGLKLKWFVEKAIEEKLERDGK